MSQSPTTHTLPLPVSVIVTANGVTVETATRVVGMSRFSARAQRLALDLGAGVHLITADTVSDVSDVTVYDLAEALS